MKGSPGHSCSDVARKGGVSSIEIAAKMVEPQETILFTRTSMGEWLDTRGTRQSQGSGGQAGVLSHAVRTDPQTTEEPDIGAVLATNAGSHFSLSAKSGEGRRSDRECERAKKSRHDVGCATQCKELPCKS